MDEIFRLDLFRKANLAGPRIGMPANVAAHTRELCAGVYLALLDHANPEGTPARGAEGTPARGAEVVWRDDRRDAETARRVAREYAGMGLRAVVGHLSASAALPAAEVYHEERILFLAPGTSHPALTDQGFDTVFRVCGRDDRQGEALSRWVRSNPTWKRVALVEHDLVYGQILSRFIQDTWGEGGPSLTCLTSSLRAESLLQTCRELLDLQPDLILVAGIYEMAAELMRSLRASGYTGEFLLSDDGFTPELLRLAGGAAEGAYLLSLSFPLADPRVERLIERYHQLTGSEVGAYFLTSYSAMCILLQALDEGGEDAEELAQILRAREWPTPLGNLRFSTNGEVDGIDWQRWQVRDGNFVSLDL